MTNGDLREPPSDELRVVGEQQSAHLDELERAEAEEIDPRPAEERYRALVEAVKRHEAVTAKSGTPRRPRDHELYRQLKSLEEFS